jgi:hypothetical protein
MDQIETFRGFVVPDMSRDLTQHDLCNLAACSGFCGNGRETKGCLFDVSNPETLEPFKQWLEERKK